MTDIISYYDGPRFGWVVICVDAEGNQLWEAQYFPNRTQLKEEFTL
jgi:hypothetical protein